MGKRKSGKQSDQQIKLIAARLVVAGESLKLLGYLIQLLIAFLKP